MERRARRSSSRAEAMPRRGSPFAVGAARDPKRCKGRGAENSAETRCFRLRRPVPVKLHTHPHFPPLHIKVNGTAPASQLGLPGRTPPRPPGLCNAGALPPRGSGGLPRGGAPGGRRGAGLARLHWLCGPEGRGKRAGLATRGPPASLALRPCTVRPGARPTSARTASREPIAGPAAPASRSARPEPHPSGGGARAPHGGQ